MIRRVMGRAAAAYMGAALGAAGWVIFRDAVLGRGPWRES